MEKKSIAQIQAERAAEYKAAHTPVRVASKPGRNDPCSCGSGKKYKKCCGKTEI